MSLSIDISYQQSAHKISIATELPNQGISGIFGPSGVGKTTLLRFIAGLDNPMTGKISFNNQTWFKPAASVSPQQRKVGFVFQDSRLFPHLDVRSNLTLAQSQTKAPQLDQAALCEAFGIISLLDKRANKLSAGQQQRVAIVRSLLAQPSLLLLDEPLAALDRHSKQTIIQQLKEHSAKHQLPMIYVSHSANEIEQLCDNLLMLHHDGRIEFGESKQLLQHYLQQQASVVACDDKLQQITLTLTAEQYQHYRQRPHLFISDDKKE